MKRYSSIDALWERLNCVKQFTRFGNSVEGKGSVIVEKTHDSSIVFYEEGCWEFKGGKSMQFKNTFRWTFERPTLSISLEHLRYGVDAPVFLFHLILSGENQLTCAKPHQCGKDVYLGALFWDSEHILLSWSVSSPKKKEKMECYYT